MVFCFIPGSCRESKERTRGSEKAGAHLLGRLPLSDSDVPAWGLGAAGEGLAVASLLLAGPSLRMTLTAEGA